MPRIAPGIVRSRHLWCALGGGLLVALAMPPWGFWPLAFVGVAVFELGLGTDGVLRRRDRALAGFLFGAGWMYLGLAWMWFLTVPGYLVAAAAFAGLHAAAAAAAPVGRWSTVGRPAAHALAEFVRIAVPFGGIPLATLGISQAGGPLLGSARIGGVPLLTWIVLQLGVVAGRAVHAVAVRRREPTPTTRTIGSELRPGLLATGAAVVLVLAASAAPRGRDTGGELTIAAVQGGGEQGTRALDVPSRLVTERHLAATASIEPSADLDLVVWPENGIDVDDRPFAGSPAADAVAAEAARLGVPFAVGVTVDSEYSAHPRPDSFVNAHVVVTPEGEVTSGYEKVHIVPFGEYVPLRGALAAVGAPVDQVPKDAVRGRDPALIQLPDGTTLGVMISFEVFFGDRGRAAGDGALLLNPTNGASYTWTIVQTQQVAASKLRAAELGRWVVQVSPTGFSAFVSPDGGVLHRTDVGERAVITMDVPLRDGATVYATIGDWPWYLAGTVLFALAVWQGRRSRVPSCGEPTGIADPPA
jgi:apolipoprotein N-acyltransferase